MHLALISIVILISCPAIYSQPVPTVEPQQRDEINLQRARPIQQFFKNVLNALRRTPVTTPAPDPLIISLPSHFHSQNAEPLQEIPNFVDFSTYLLGSFAANNSAIKFTYQDNNSSMPQLRGNYSVISFLVPHSAAAHVKEGSEESNIFKFFNYFRFPWNRQTTTEISKFPPILEYVAQRIQAYFSIYKFPDESRLNNTIVVFQDENDVMQQVYNSDNDEKDTTTTTTDIYENETTTAAFDNELQDDLTTTETAMGM